MSPGAVSLAPRVRVILLLALAASASLLTSWMALLPVAAAALVLALAAGMPFSGLLRRLAWLVYLGAGLFVTLPLAVPGSPLFEVRAGWIHLTGSLAGLEKAGLISLRMLAGFLGALALTASTPLPELLQALAGLGVPRFFVLLAGMAVRYVALLRDEARRQLVSRRSRCYRPAGTIWHRRTLHESAQTLGMLFLRAYDRSERIYWSMMSRGYSPVQAPAPPDPLSRSERWTVAAAVLLGTGLVLLDHRIARG